MKKIYLLLLFACTLATAQDITGHWNGLLQIPGSPIRFTLNITKTATGYSATAGSPDQGPGEIPVDNLKFENNTLVFAVPAAGVQYTGTWENNGFTGTFDQNGYKLPLNFTREEITTAKPARPQEPVKPYPYHEEEVSFTNAKAGITLSGTLTLPKKEGNFPAVILVSGSGPQDRDEEIFGHKPFMVLADHLTRNGVAVLRYDDRGVGKSGGDFATALTTDFAADAEAAFNYLKTRKEINKKKIGIAGHSEGGIAAPIVAASNKDVAFIVLLAGPGLPGDEMLVLQNYLIGKASGMPEAQLEQNKVINRSIYSIITTETDRTLMRTKLGDVFDKQMKPLYQMQLTPPDEINKQRNAFIEESVSPWLIGLLKHNPAPVLEKVKCPILAVNGAKDVQVGSQQNLQAIKKAAEKGGNKNVTVKEFPGLNHLFQETGTGLTDEYGTIEQTFSPVVLNEVSAWIKSVIN